MEMILSFFQQALGYVGPFIILLGLLIFVHELGHFLVAKYFNVRVEVFSMGFGKKILQRKWGDTNYCISLIPLGGYVKMFGDDPTAEIAESEKDRSFLHKPVSQRIAVVLAGPLMNLFFAWLVFMVIGLIGEKVPSSRIGDIAQDSPAYSYGFRSGDKITEIDGRPVQTWSEVTDYIKNLSNNRVKFSVEREGDNSTEVVNAGIDLVENMDIFSSQKQVGGVKGLELQSEAAVIGVGQPNSLVAKSGLQSFDIIKSIGGKEVSYWRQIEPYLGAFAGKTVELIVKNYKPGEESNERRIKLDLSNVMDVNLAGLGIESSESYILTVTDDSPAQAAGILSGDKITALNGKIITAWEDILNTVKNFKNGDPPIIFSLVRNGEEKTISVTPRMTELMNRKLKEEQRFTVGIRPGRLNAAIEPYLLKQTAGSTFTYGFDQTVHWTYMTVIGIVRLIQREVSARNVAGVITIGRVAGHSFQVGISPFLKVMAIISINLFILNLLPIPILDGGHLLFYSIEALRGAPLSMRKMEIAQQVGLIIMMTLMAFALFNDINNLFNTP